MRILSKLTLVLSATLILSACGGGGSSNDAVQGQGRTQFNLANTSGADIQRVQVTQLSNNLVTSDQKFECANGQSCAFNSDANEASQFVFFDANQKPIAAYYNYMPADYVNLRISRAMTGLYVFKQIDDSTPQTTGIVAAQLTNYFSLNPSPDMTSDFYQELGQYYLNQVVRGSMQPEDFYKKVLDEAGTGVVLEKGAVNYASSRPLSQTLLALIDKNFSISSVRAASTCSVVGDLFNASGGISAAVHAWTNVMSAGIAAPLISVVGQIFGSNCDDGTGAKLDSMTNQLNLMQSQLKNIESDLQGVKQYLESQNANFAMVQLNTYVQDMNKAFSNYSAVLANGKYTGLRDYIDKNGGLEKAINGNAYLKKLFVCDGSNACLDDQLKNVNLLTEGSLIDNFASSINSSCANLPTNNINVEDLREMCNTKILKFNGFMVATLVNASSILKDEYDTLQYYADNGNASTKEYLNKSGFAKPYSRWSDGGTLTTDKSINPTISRLKSIFAGPVAGLFDPLGEFKKDHQILYSSIASIAMCRVNGSQIPNIIGWYPNASMPYINVMCTDGSGAVVSRYHYKNDADQVGVVMGVLVPTNMMRSITDTNRSTDNRDGYYAWSSEDLKGSQEAGYLLPYASNANTNGFYPSVDAGDPLGGKLVMAQLNGKITHASFEGGNIKLTYNPSDIGFNENYNYMWLRYTSDDNSSSVSRNKSAKVSRVFKIKHSGYSDSSGRWIYDQMKCVTSDCFVGNRSVRFENGPTIKVIIPSLIDPATFWVKQLEVTQ